MHKQKNLLNIVFLGSNDFINSLNELKEDLNFNLSILKSFNNYDLPSNYDAFLIEPEIEHISGVFKKSKKAKIQIWLTADERRIPLRIKSKVAVGSFVADLVDGGL